MEVFAMLGLLPQRRPVSVIQRRVRLSLEALELRDCPSVSHVGLLGHGLADHGAHHAPGIVQMATPLPPVIVGFTGTGGYSNYWTFSGKVCCSNAAGLVVTFGGLPELQGKTATVAADGTFKITVQLRPGECGEATAQTTDSYGQLSNLAWFLVEQPMPGGPPSGGGGM
jgi:hypothetical protein